MKYKVEVSRTGYGFVEVEADDEQQASDIATQKEINGEVTWTNSDAEICRVEAVK